MAAGPHSRRRQRPWLMSGCRSTAAWKCHRNSARRRSAASPRQSATSTSSTAGASRRRTSAAHSPGSNSVRRKRRADLPGRLAITVQTAVTRVDCRAVQPATAHRGLSHRAAGHGQAGLCAADHAGVLGQDQPHRDVCRRFAEPQRHAILRPDLHRQQHQRLGVQDRAIPGPHIRHMAERSFAGDEADLPAGGWLQLSHDCRCLGCR